MGATVFKQPNGLYGRYSYVCDDFTDVNMTKEEYIVTRLDHDLRDSEDTLNNHLGKYENVLKDAQAHVDLYDEYIKEAETKKDKQKFVQKKKDKQEHLDMMNKYMNDTPPADTLAKYDEFYKESLKMLNNLFVESTVEDWKYERKKYVPNDYPDDLAILTEKIKEINQLYEDLKNKKSQD
jgi:hypothetical protein